MQVKTGYLYHIKDEFFQKYNNYNLMQNHELGKTRPTYFTIKDKNILWFIPLSTKIEKYKKIIGKKIKKYGTCETILIKEVLNKPVAVLIQNTFPTTKEYIDHVHMIHAMPAKVSEEVKEEILFNFKKLLKMKKHGLNLFFTDIDGLKQELLDDEVVKTCC